ncbi:MAG: metallophosphoesterase [Oscillospiraceae bacterium]|nr:metallophosphoesterase [Oscillospiraceae bacterium]
MSVYVMSDLHGNYEGFQAILKQIHFSHEDELYLNGDVVDRGPDGIKILQYMMLQPNIYPILGNHEYALLQVLNFVTQEITEETIEQVDAELLQSIPEYQSIGGQVTLDAFHKLSREEQQDIMEYLGEFTAYEELSVDGREFLLVHAGLSHFRPERPMEDYQLYELIFESPNYGQVYFETKYLVTGHLPTMAIPGAVPHEIYMANNHIAIDCGAGFDGRVGCIRLNDLRCFYS